MSQVQFSAKKVAQEASQCEELNDADLMAVVGGGLLDTLTGTATGVIDADELDGAVNLPLGLDGAVSGGGLEQTVGNVVGVV